MLSIAAAIDQGGQALKLRGSGVWLPGGKKYQLGQLFIFSTQLHRHDRTGDSDGQETYHCRLVHIVIILISRACLYGVLMNQSILVARAKRRGRLIRWRSGRAAEAKGWQDQPRYLLPFALTQQVPLDSPIHLVL